MSVVCRANLRRVETARECWSGRADRRDVIRLTNDWNEHWRCHDYGILCVILSECMNRGLSTVIKLPSST